LANLAQNNLLPLLPSLSILPQTISKYGNTGNKRGAYGSTMPPIFPARFSALYLLRQRLEPLTLTTVTTFPTYFTSESEESDEFCEVSPPNQIRKLHKLQNR
jgi:hypothetical protein